MIKVALLVLLLLFLSVVAKSAFELGEEQRWHYRPNIWSTRTWQSIGFVCVLLVGVCGYAICAVA